MLVISILEAEDFGDELYSLMRENLIGLINVRHAGVIIAAGESKGMIYRLFSELAVEYPHVFFTILLPNDKLAYEGSHHLFSINCDFAYYDHKSAKERRRITLIERSDIIICRQKNCNEIRKNNYYCEIIAV